MNDFTKEELIMLKRLTLQHVNQFRQNSDCIELMSKIQSMIDNYDQEIVMVRGEPKKISEFIDE